VEDEAEVNIKSETKSEKSEAENEELYTNIDLPETLKLKATNLNFQNSFTLSRV
jgi:hypothetical protein